MPRTLWPVDAVSGAPLYSGKMLRQALAVLLGGGKASRPLGGQTGIRPGTGALGSATSTTWTVNPHAGCLDLETSNAAGPYFYSIDDTANTGSITAADATNPRVDIVYVTLNDPSQSDGSATPDVFVGYLAGTPSGSSPSAPMPPARSMVLFQINVPKQGGGSPTVTNVAPYTVAAGAPIPVRSQAERDALSAYDGLQVYRLDTHTTETYGPTSWQQGRIILAAGTGPDGGFSVSSPPIASGVAPAQWWRDSAGVVHGMGAFGYTTGQASTTSRSLGAIIPPSMTAATSRGAMTPTVNFHAGSFYGTGKLTIDPYANTAKIEKSDGTAFSWAGNDNWISIDDITFDPS